MPHTSSLAPWENSITTGRLLLEDGTVIEALGVGAEGFRIGELCFNTALTGYQEILTDPSYMGQIVTFTFPHIGNVGTNTQDHEDLHDDEKFGAVGAIFKAPISTPSNYRACSSLEAWLKNRGLVALYGVDTRALTTLLREKGAQNALIAYARDGLFDIDFLKEKLRLWPGLNGQDLAKDVSSQKRQYWDETPWTWDRGFSKHQDSHKKPYHIVVIDYGIKRNILRLLTTLNARITIVPATTPAKDILALAPDGIFLSNGPGDPAATGAYAVPIIQDLLKARIPIFGICLGHQLLALASGAKTLKMHQGHHGANHPVQDFTTNKVEIVSMNHGFAVDRTTLPAHVVETHISLFDGSNCGIAFKDRPAFSVQYHPEASPGPQDSYYLFERFYQMLAEHKKSPHKNTISSPL